MDADADAAVLEPDRRTDSRVGSIKPFLVLPNTKGRRLVVLGYSTVPGLVVHGHERPQLIPFLFPLLRVLLSVVQPNGIFSMEK